MPVRLPDAITACLFDLDGVLTDTAKVHAKAWKQMFDAYLRTEHPDQAPFDAVRDYDEHVDGRPRYDGVRSFLTTRGIAADDALVHRLGDRKNELLLGLIRDEGVEAYPGSVRFVEAARAAGLHTAVVSSSANCRDVLAAAGILELFEARVDGVALERDHLSGKPAPDSFVAGARALGVEPAHAAVFEDALAGVEAGRAGGFAIVVGVDRVGQAAALREHGATVVVEDLAELVEPG